ncbi:hypothetical protein YB2330_001746 [Saitoella coloradoensis]
MQIRSREEILEYLTSLSTEYESEIDADMPMSSPSTSPTPLVNNDEGSSTSVAMELDAADEVHDATLSAPATPPLSSPIHEDCEQPHSLTVAEVVTVTDTAHEAKVGEEACGAAAFDTSHPPVPAAEDDLHIEQQETTSNVPKELPSRFPIDVVGTDDVLPSTVGSIAMAQAADMVKNTDDAAHTFESSAASRTTQCHKSIKTSHSLSLYMAEDAGGVTASDHRESPSAAMIVPPQREEETNSTSIERPMTPPKTDSPYSSRPSSIEGAGEQVSRLADADVMEDVVFEFRNSSSQEGVLAQTSGTVRGQGDEEVTGVLSSLDVSGAVEVPSPLPSTLKSPDRNRKDVVPSVENAEDKEIVEEIVEDIVNKTVDQEAMQEDISNRYLMEQTLRHKARNLDWMASAAHSRAAHLAYLAQQKRSSNRIDTWAQEAAKAVIQTAAASVRAEDAQATSRAEPAIPVRSATNKRVAVWIQEEQPISPPGKSRKTKEDSSPLRSDETSVGTLKSRIVTFRHETSIACPSMACYHTFATQQALNAHAKNVHKMEIVDGVMVGGWNLKSFKCSCGKTFPDEMRIVQHLVKDHAGQPRYKCPIPCCEFVTSKVEDLIPHLRGREHFGKRPKICYECRLHFFDRNLYKAHRLSDKCRGNAGLNKKAATRASSTCEFDFLGST